MTDIIDYDTDPIYQAVTETPLYGLDKLTDKQARTVAFEIREAVRLETVRYQQMVTDLRQAQQWAGLLSAHFPGFGDRARTLTVDELVVGWVNPETKTVGLTAHATGRARSVLAVVTQWAASNLVDPAPFLSIPTGSLKDPPEDADRELFDTIMVNETRQVFPIQVAVNPGWTIEGTRPDWVKTTVNVDVIEPGISRGRDGQPVDTPHD